VFVIVLISIAEPDFTEDDVQEIDNPENSKKIVIKIKFIELNFPKNLTPGISGWRECGLTVLKERKRIHC